MEAITDKKTREHYARMARAQYNYVLASLIQNEATEQKKNVVEFPEYVEIMRTNDMNDEFNIECGLSYMILSHEAGVNADFGGDMTPYCLAIMNVADSLATPAAKKAFARLCAFQYFSFGADGNDEFFWNRFKTFAADYPELIAQYQGNIEARAKTTQGKAAPDATLTRPDGTTCRLSELFGKFLYIDVWATWCGPCCAVIPYLEKVAAHFKGNDKVAVVSISIDTNKEAWTAKLKADQPEWLQFILTPEEAAAFQQAWGIQGIPRFIMIDAEGKIFNADAPRPSDEDTIEIIEEQIN